MEKTMTMYLVKTKSGGYVYNGYETNSIARSLWVNKDKAQKCADQIYEGAQVIEVELKIKDKSL